MKKMISRRDFLKVAQKPQPFVWGFSLAQKRSFCAKLPTNRAFGPVRRARRGAILNEKGVHHPFFKLFSRTCLLLLCFFRQSDALRAIGRAGRFFYSSSNNASA